MFFGMTNLLVIFQAMMNKILRDLINKGKVIVFVDSVLVGTEIEENHDEIVEEILKRFGCHNLAKWLSHFLFFFWFYFI